MINQNQEAEENLDEIKQQYKKNVSEKMVEVKKNEINISHMINKLNLAKKNGKGFEDNLNVGKEPETVKPVVEVKNQSTIGNIKPTY
jgi:uncharacterized protein YktB (UPF0637 family)